MSTSNLEVSLLDTWLKKDPVRWIAGAMAGCFAGLVMALFAGLVCKFAGLEFFFPIKMAAIPVYGANATELGLNLMPMTIGLITHLLLSTFLGVIYSHFTISRTFTALFGMGIVWALFSWIFINNLFTPSFTGVLALGISQGAAFFVHLVFGLSLVSLGFFEKVLRD